MGAPASVTRPEAGASVGRSDLPQPVRETAREIISRDADNALRMKTIHE
jgi:hypothetical protein